VRDPETVLAEMFAALKEIEPTKFRSLRLLLTTDENQALQ
jgi:hypothetical protein